MLRMSLCIDVQRPWSEVRRIALALDAADWHCAYVPDHFMPTDGGARVVPGPFLESWTCLTAIAAATSRLRVAPLVLGAAYRHPAVVANMAASLDQVSGGRVTLGVGAGWQENEHRAYGIPLLSTAARMDRFEESCAVMRLLLRAAAPTTFRGRHFALVGARCEPQPVQRLLPLLVGGGGERRTLLTAARHGDLWHSWGTPDEIRRKGGILDEHCAAVGRAPSDVERVSGASVSFADSGPGDPGEVAGSPGRVAQVLADYEAVGVCEFVVRDDARVPVHHTLSTIERIDGEVRPLLA